MVKLYLSTAREIEVKLKSALETCSDEKLKKYSDYVSLFINQIDGHLQKSGTIPSEEKCIQFLKSTLSGLAKANAIQNLVI